MSYIQVLPENSQMINELGAVEEVVMYDTNQIEHDL